MQNSFLESFNTKLRLTLFFFLVSATLGLLLRFVQTGLISANFKYILHTHSHIVLLGWLYNAVVIVIQYLIFKKEKGPLNSIFWLSQITFFGMMFSFPFQGYAFASITFSTLYLFCTYALVYYLFKYSTRLENKAVRALIKWAGVFLVLSSFGPYSLAFIMAKGLAATFWYKLSIYWFLHFLFNGFFTLIIFSFILFKLPLFKFQNIISQFMIWSVIPVYGLSVLWLTPHWVVYIISFLGTIFQLVAFLLLLKSVSFRSLFSSKWPQLLFQLSFIAYSLKVVFQIISVVPVVQTFLQETMSYSVIGFIHLVMLGFFTLFILGVLIENKWVNLSSLTKLGVTILILGIVLSEFLLFLQSICVYFQLFTIPNYFLTLALISALMPIGIGLITMDSLTPAKKHQVN